MSKKEKKAKIRHIQLEEKGMTAYELKFLAMFTMVLDHVAYIYWRPLGGTGQIMRFLGRFTFPLMAFLITEGLRHTRNRAVYVSRILICALVSMIPYKMLFGEPYNVMFTLAAGLILLILEEEAIRRMPKVSPYVWQILFLLLAACAAFLMREFDWGLPGILAIYVTGQLKHRPYWIQGIGCCSTLLIVTIIRRLWEHSAFTPQYCFFISGIAVAAIWIALYNGRRGTDRKYQKYAFYAFYPMHILLIWVSLQLF